MNDFGLGDTLRLLVLALGAALLVGNVAVILKERRRSPDDTSPRPNMRVVSLNIAVGTVLTVWAVVSLALA